MHALAEDRLMPDGVRAMTQQTIRWMVGRHSTEAVERRMMTY